MEAGCPTKAVHDQGRVQGRLARLPLIGAMEGRFGIDRPHAFQIQLKKDPSINQVVKFSIARTENRTAVNELFHNNNNILWGCDQGLWQLLREYDNSFTRLHPVMTKVTVASH